MLEIHPRGQTEDVKGKGTIIKPSLEMMRFFVFFFSSLKYLHFNVTSAQAFWEVNSLVATGDERQDAPQDYRRSTGVWPLH